MNMKKILIVSIVAAICVFTAVARSASEQSKILDIVTTHVPSPAKVTVVVPQKYLEKDDTCRYNVVYLLHGHGGDYKNYAAKMRLDSLSDRYNVIFVCPDGHNSWYWDSPVNPGMQMESYIVDDLVGEVDRQYRTVADRKGRSIAGLSMGGHGAMWLAMRHKDLFSRAGSMSGGLDIAQFKGAWDTGRWLGSEADEMTWRDHSVMTLVDDLKPGELDVIVMCGSDDAFAGVNEEFHRRLMQRGVKHSYIMTDGNHSWRYWTLSLPVILDFFDKVDDNRF